MALAVAEAGAVLESSPPWTRRRGTCRLLDRSLPPCQVCDAAEAHANLQMRLESEHAGLNGPVTAAPATPVRRLLEQPTDRCLSHAAKSRWDTELPIGRDLQPSRHRAKRRTIEWQCQARQDRAVRRCGQGPRRQLSGTAELARGAPSLISSRHLGPRRAARSGADHWLPRRDVEPLRMELLVERQVMGSEARQLVGALDGVRVPALALYEARAGADVRVPACGPSPLRPFARLPRERLGMNGSSTAAQYAAIVASGRATRSSESKTTGGCPPASRTAACSSCSASTPTSWMRMSGHSA